MNRLPVVLLHGFLGSHRDLHEIRRGLEAQWTCHAIDLPGHNGTPIEATSFMNGVAEVRQRIRDLDVERCHLFGYSMGGRIALALTVQDRGLAATTMVIGARAGIVDADERRQRHDADRQLADRLQRDGLEPFLEQWYEQPLFQTLRRCPRFPALLARRRSGEAAALAQALRTFSVGNQPVLQDGLATTGTEVLALAGQLDTTYAARNAELAARCPNVTAKTVPNAGHAAHAERPAEVVALLSDFLARQTEP